jgi:sarcosine oxidase subunit beta
VTGARRWDVAVIGGGLMGLSIALACARAGMAVLLLEAGRVGRGASGASAGGVRSLNRHPAEIALVRAALPLWRDAGRDLGRDVGFRASGQIRVAMDDAAMARLEARAAMTRELGHDHERVVDAAALTAREPGLAGRGVGALLVEDDGFADPLASLRAYRAIALAAGATIRERTPVRALARDGAGFALETDAGPVRAGLAVNAAGAWGAALAAQVGEPAAATPVALQMIVTQRMGPLARATLGVEGAKLSLKQSAEGTVVIGGGFEAPIDAAGLGRPRLADVAASLTTAARLFPALRRARVARIWAGVEGVTADGLPVLGASRAAPGLVHAFGFSAHGFALAPLIGPLVADLLRGRETNLSLAPFAPGRFAPESFAAIEREIA